MFYDQLINLQRYITKECAIKCIIGNDVLGPNSYPAVRIIHTNKGTFNRNTQHGGSAHLPVTLEVVAGRKEEAKVWKAMDELFTKLNNFESEEGHQIDDDFLPGYEENTFKILIGYDLMVRFLNKP